MKKEMVVIGEIKQKTYPFIATTPRIPLKKALDIDMVPPNSSFSGTRYLASDNPESVENAWLMTVNSPNITFNIR